MAAHPYTASVRWERRSEEPFTDNRYSRAHTWRFDGGIEVPGSSSAHVVRLPFSVEAAVDPEEAFVAALSSCHMLSFLYLAAKGGFRVDRYVDEATGVLDRTPAGRMAMTRVTLFPRVTFSGLRMPSKDEIDAMHHQAHEDCYIANSVTTEVRCQPVLEP
ncbi:MAG TPA: OsmC family protein [Steroidobacteraceae bacterium]|jgi:organic hydroperoxide reductase OsmC/OhrA